MRADELPAQDVRRGAQRRDGAGTRNIRRWLAAVAREGVMMTERFICNDVDDRDLDELAYEIQVDPVGIIRMLRDSSPGHLGYAFTWAFTDEGSQYWCDRYCNGVLMSDGDWYKIRFYAQQAGLIA
jgi:hypothetical protein